MTKTPVSEHLDEDNPTIQIYNFDEFAQYILAFEKSLFEQIGTTKSEASAQNKLDVAEYNTRELCGYLNSIPNKDERLAALTHLVFNKGIFSPYPDYANQFNEVFAAADLEDRILNFCQAIPPFSYDAANIPTLKNQLCLLVEILNKEDQRAHLVQEIMKQAQHYLLSIADPVRRFEILSDLIFLENLFFDGSYATEILTLLQNSGLDDKKIAFFSELERKIETAIMFSLAEERDDFISVGRALLKKFIEADTPEECYEKLTQVVISGNLFYHPALIHLVVEVFLEKNFGPVRQNDFYEKILADANYDYDKLHVAVKFHNFCEHHNRRAHARVEQMEGEKTKSAMPPNEPWDQQSQINFAAQETLRAQDERYIGFARRARNAEGPVMKYPAIVKPKAQRNSPGASPSYASANIAASKSKQNCNIS